MNWCYTVRVAFSGDSAMAAADRWVEWMTTRHLADVLKAGARSARLVRMNTETKDPPCFEARYEFQSREAFGQYERIHAPALRAEGLQLFPVESGISYSRTQGQLIFQS